MNFPKPEISRDSAMELWITERSDYAKEQLILNNVGMIGIVMRSISLNPLDEDLFATGLVGIVKAVNTFDGNKGFSFSSYATLVIRNEILMTFRKKRIVPSISLDEPYIPGEHEGHTYAEMIEDDSRFEDEVISNIQFEKTMDSLSKRERTIITLRMDGKLQREIAEICGISRPRVSKIIKKIFEKFKE